MPGALGQRRFVGRIAAAARAPRAGSRVETPAASAPERSTRAAASDGRSVCLPADPHWRIVPASRTAASPCRAQACAASAAPDSAAAAMVRAIRSALANGRAASWITTTSVCSATSLKRVGDRILPPRAAGDDPERLGRCRRRYAGGAAARSAGSATMTSSTSGCARNAETLRSRIGRPPIDSSCLGLRRAEPLDRARRPQ